mmetsp:Transcript_38557/g.114566  ORF Transcript_38557/g.114566 Transcript_38557/m.114566 type:complete len:257 (+) Transcript_38557:503-1273(+)
MHEKRSSSTHSPNERSSSHASSALPQPCQAASASEPNVSTSRAARTASHASHIRCSSRAISEYFSSTYSRLASGAAARSHEQRSVRKASTVCMPLTSENFRSDKYSASDWESGTVATAEQKGEKSPMPGASGTMEPRHGSASTAIASGRTSLPVQTRSTMQSTTLTRPSSASPSRTTASWSFSHAKSSGGTSPSSAAGSWLSSGVSTLAIAAPSEQESDVALCTIGSSSSVESPNTSACGGKKSGVPSDAAIASSR